MNQQDGQQHRSIGRNKARTVPNAIFCSIAYIIGHGLLQCTTRAFSCSQATFTACTAVKSRILGRAAHSSGGVQGHCQRLEQLQIMHCCLHASITSLKLSVLEILTFVVHAMAPALHCNCAGVVEREVGA
jgi:hypothetical protein